MIALLIKVAIVVAAFVAGVLVGRANKKKVEAVIAEAKAVEAKAATIVKKK